MSTPSVALNIIRNNKENTVNKVQQGMLNRRRIKGIIREYPVITPSLITYETGIRLETVQYQLKRLHEQKQVFRQKRGLGEEFLYREVGKGYVKQDDHMESVAQDWSRVRKGAKLLQVLLADEMPKEFVSTKGTTVPDLVFSLLMREKRFYTWETDLGNERGKEAFLKKLIGMWYWRREHCSEFDPTTKRRQPKDNVWGIKTITMLTSTTTDRHMRNLINLVPASHPEGKVSEMFLFTSRERWWKFTDPRHLFTQPIWFDARHDQPRALVGG